MQQAQSDSPLSCRARLVIVTKKNFDCIFFRIRKIFKTYVFRTCRGSHFIFIHNWWRKILSRRLWFGFLKLLFCHVINFLDSLDFLRKSRKLWFLTFGTFGIVLNSELWVICPGASSPFFTSVLEHGSFFHPLDASFFKSGQSFPLLNNFSSLLKPHLSVSRQIYGSFGWF